MEKIRKVIVRILQIEIDNPHSRNSNLNFDQLAEISVYCHLGSNNISRSNERFKKGSSQCCHKPKRICVKHKRAKIMLVVQIMSELCT